MAIPILVCITAQESPILYISELPKIKNETIATRFCYCIFAKEQEFFKTNLALIQKQSVFSNISILETQLFSRCL
jgi:hypothetical protein